MIGNFNEEAQTVLMNAKKEMLDLGHPYIGTEHLLFSILKTNSNITERLNNYDLYYDNFKEELSKVVGTSKKKSEYFLYYIIRFVEEESNEIERENHHRCDGFGSDLGDAEYGCGERGIPVGGSAGYGQ